MKVALVGLWHQGIVAASCLSSLGHKVYAYDCDQNKIDILSAGKSPIFEPGLENLIGKGLEQGNLFFRAHFDKDMSECDLLILAHDTPVNENDESDIKGILDDLDRMISFLPSNLIIHVTAQVPVGTCEFIKQKILSNREDINLEMCYSPENLRLGQAIDLYINPALPVIGAESKDAFERLSKIYSFTDKWVFTSLKTSEMLKHALNSYLATCITFANSIGNICDQVGVDGFELGRLLKLEPRIGSKTLLNPGLGFSGGTLARDVVTLKNLSQKYNLDNPLFETLIRANDLQNEMLYSKISDVFNGQLEDKKIVIWGVTYKPNTSTLRRSPAIKLVRQLIGSGSQVFMSDPEADLFEVATNIPNAKFDRDPATYINEADLLLVLTPWDEFKVFTAEKLNASLKNKIIFDPFGIYSSIKQSFNNIKYIRIGDGAGLGG